MARPGLLVVTGASGVGKTTLIRALADRTLPGVTCHHFDSIGVPSPEEMVRRDGSGEGWQAATTGEWISRLARETPAGGVAVLEGQTRPSFVEATRRETPDMLVEMVLVDCDHVERDRRLTAERGQPELANQEMASWASYLRREAEERGLPILDTGVLSVGAALAELESHVERLRRHLRAE